MANKTCVLIIKENKVFIIKNNDEWMFPTFEQLKNEDLFCDINERIILFFNDLIKDDGIHIYSRYNEKYISGKFYSLKIDVKDFNPNNYQEFKWITLEDIDTIKWNEESNTLIEELKKYLSKQFYSIRIDEDKITFKKKDEDEFEDFFGEEFADLFNELGGDEIWSDTCSLLEAERKFGEIIREQAHKYHVTKKISKWRTIRLYDENGIEIRRES